MTKTNYEDKPLYRFFNVIFILLYILVVLSSFLGGYLTFTSRPLSNARVLCEDGTNWNALKPKDITWNDSALCGVCTKRNDETQKYANCDYGDPGYYTSHQIIDKKYAFSLWIIFTPLLIYFIGVGIVDFLKLATIYVFSGSWLWYKSLFILTLGFIVGLFYSDRNSTEKIS